MSSVDDSLSTKESLLATLHKAAERGDVDEVRKLVERGVDVNATSAGQHSPLHLAILGGHLDTVTLLLAFGARPLDDTANGPLDLAVRAGSGDMVRYLLGHGVEISSGHALLTAVELDAIEIVKRLLDHSLSGNGVPLSHAMPPTLLSVAVTNSSLEMANLLIQRGFSPIACPDALLLAASQGSVHLTALLLASGAMVTYRDHMGYTALSHAARVGQTNVIGLLLPHIPSQYFAVEALIAAASTGKEDAFAMLWQYCSPGEILSVGSGVIVAAAKAGHVGIMRSLLSHHRFVAMWSEETRPGVSAQPLEYQNPDFHAPTFKGVEIGKWYDITDASIAACAHGHIEIVKILTENINRKVSEQHIGAAIRGRQYELVQYLFSIDAEMSPGIFQLAAEEGDGHMCQLLLDRITVGNKHKIHLGTCLAAASKKGNLTLVDQFLSKGRELGIPSQLNVPLAISVAVENDQNSTAVYLIESQQSFTLENTWIRHSLTVAVAKGFADVIIKLLHQGVAMNFERRFCYDLLYTAHQIWHPDIVESLLQSSEGGMNPEASGLDIALEVASSKEHDELHRFLLARKEKDLSKRQVDRQNPFSWFELVFHDLQTIPTPYTHNETEFSRLLDDPKISLRIQALNQIRHPLLWSALITVSQSVVLKLISRGADVNLEGQHGNRPLHTAASMGYDAIVKALLEGGADPNLEDDAADTPLDAAIASKAISVVHCLIDFGTIVDLRTMALTVRRYEVSVVPLSVLVLGWESSPLFLDIRQRLQERPELKVELLRCIIQMHLAEWIHSHREKGTSMLDDPSKSQSIDEGTQQDLEMRIYENWLSTADESGNNPFRKILNKLCVDAAGFLPTDISSGQSNQEDKSLLKANIRMEIVSLTDQLNNDIRRLGEQNEEKVSAVYTGLNQNPVLAGEGDHAKAISIGSRASMHYEGEAVISTEDKGRRKELKRYPPVSSESLRLSAENVVEADAREEDALNNEEPIEHDAEQAELGERIARLRWQIQDLQMQLQGVEATGDIPIARLTDQQITILEANFKSESKPTTLAKRNLGHQLNLPLWRVNVSATSRSPKSEHFLKS